MTKWKIYNEDAVSWAKTYDKGRFHALLTDTPYNLESITKRFGKNGSAKAKYGKDGVFQRSSKGFMNQAWDTDIAFRPETWAAFSEVLYPGAFGMAFSASRNWHRMAVAIEDAGFIIHPTMFFLWINGQGFPKATRVKGHEGFDGHRYGLQALKPSVEPIIVFQKPYEGKPVDNIVSTGAGALNIDAARIGLDGGGTHCNNRDDNGNCLGHNNAGRSTTGQTVHSKVENLHRNSSHKQSWKQTSPDGSGHMNDDWKQGRWPSNLILDEVSAEKLDEQSGERSGSKPIVRKPGFRRFNGTDYANGQEYHTENEYTSTGYEDNGGASRFFYQVSTQLDEADPFLYQSKVSPKERNAGLDEKNNHPTLKPINLAKYLATLLLPPVEYAPRRIFIPFSGSGSEMIGAGLAGWEHVVGVEFDTENNYVEIAKKRLEHWLP